jgi:hypothetical protein
VASLPGEFQPELSKKIRADCLCSKPSNEMKKAADNSFSPFQISNVMSLLLLLLFFGVENTADVN